MVRFGSRNTVPVFGGRLCLGSDRFSSETDKTGHRIWIPYSCFHVTAISPVFQPELVRTLRPGTQMICILYVCVFLLSPSVNLCALSMCVGHLRFFGFHEQNPSDRIRTQSGVAWFGSRSGSKNFLLIRSKSQNYRADML